LELRCANASLNRSNWRTSSAECTLRSVTFAMRLAGLLANICSAPGGAAPRSSSALFPAGDMSFEASTERKHSSGKQDAVEKWGI
jgi:hypothetical protein